MTALRRGTAALLRWYPPGWRERYGDELAALMEDTTGGEVPSVRLRASVAWAGLRERGHEAGVLGQAAAPTSRMRGGSLLVLCAWVAFVVAGSSFAKLAEHFEGSVPAHARALPVDAFTVVQWLATVAGLAVVAGAVVALPSSVRFLRAGGWPRIRRHVLRAGAATLLVLAAGIPLVATAHRLTPPQRNGGSLGYSLAFLGVCALVVAMAALWTVAAVVTVRRLGFGPRALLAEGTLAGTVALSMLAITAATAVWWASIATSAPWFLWGTPVGSAGSAFEPQLVATMVLMVLAAVAAGYGAGRIARSMRDLRTA